MVNVRLVDVKDVLITSIILISYKIIAQLSHLENAEAMLRVVSFFPVIPGALCWISIPSSSVAFSVKVCVKSVLMERYMAHKAIIQQVKHSQPTRSRVVRMFSILYHHCELSVNDSWISCDYFILVESQQLDLKSVCHIVVCNAPRAILHRVMIDFSVRQWKVWKTEGYSEVSFNHLHELTFSLTACAWMRTAIPHKIQEEVSKPQVVHKKGWLTDVVVLILYSCPYFVHLEGISICTLHSTSYFSSPSPVSLRFQV